jgi:hypothetical protein
MKSNHATNFLLALSCVLLLASCGGSGGASVANGGGIGGSGVITYGSITAFGSVFVNRTEFDTSEAIIVVGGEEIGVGDDVAMNNLDVGRVVTVEGVSFEEGTHTADRVIYSKAMEGPVESVDVINLSAKELVVLGQTVIVDVDTAFKGTTFDTVQPNDVVEVSGLVDDTHAIRATFLEKTGQFMVGMAVEISGLVKDLNSLVETFKINSLVVDYSMADTSALPGGVLTEGLRVEVEGILDEAGGEVLATAVQLADELGDGDADLVEVLGFVTDFVSVFQFTVGFQPVRTDEETLFIDGTADDVELGAKMEVGGRLENGILFADEIEFWEPGQIEVEGLVTDFVSASEFTVGDQLIQTDEYTLFVDGNPEEIDLGVKLEVKGKLSGDVLIADKVSFEDV